MQVVFRTIRVFGQIQALSFARMSEYRSSFIAQNITVMFYSLFEIAFFLLLYRQVESIAGWGVWEVLFLVALMRLFWTLYWTVLAPNLYSITELVRSGGLDVFLLRPFSPFLNIIWRNGGIYKNGFADYVLILIVMTHFWGSFTMLHFLSATLVFGVAAVAMLALHTILVSMSFWFIGGEEGNETFWELMKVLQYPGSIYGNALRIILTLVFPILVVTNFPAEIIFGTIEGGEVALGLLACVGLIFLARIVWRAGLKRYESSSS